MQNDASRSLFATNMGVRPGERSLVFSDMIRPDETPSGQDRDRRERLLTVAQEVAEYAEQSSGEYRCS